MAKKINIKQDSGRLEVSYNWRSPVMWFLVVWCAFWDISIVTFLFSGAGIAIGLHLLVGVLMTYYLLTLFINSTTITIDRQALRVNHGPLPWFTKKHVITSRSLQQLYVDKQTTQKNNKQHHTYSLQALLNTGADITLVKGESNINTVQNLERTIEDFLEIKNDASLDLTASGKSPKELARMIEGTKKMRESMEGFKWIPESVKDKLNRQEEVMRRELEAAQQRGNYPDTPHPGSNAPSSSPLDADGPLVLNTGTARPKPLPAPDHDFNFPLYAQSEGTNVRYKAQPYRVGRSAQIDWADEHATTGRQIELVAATGGDDLYIYTQLERERWTYFEQRRLDDAEAETLGFNDTSHPLRFNNGEERYYPRDRQNGTRFIGGTNQIVIQYMDGGNFEAG